MLMLGNFQVGGELVFCCILKTYSHHFVAAADASCVGLLHPQKQICEFLRAKIAALKEAAYEARDKAQEEASA